MSWEINYDDEGNTFYVQSETGETSWEKPNGEAPPWDEHEEYEGEEESWGEWPENAAPYQKTSEDGDEEGAEELWEEILDESGLPYYYNEATGVTRWEMPAMEDDDSESGENGMYSANILTQSELSGYEQQSEINANDLELSHSRPLTPALPEGEFYNLLSRVVSKVVARSIEKGCKIASRTLEKEHYQGVKKRSNRTKKSKGKGKNRAGIAGRASAEGDYDAWLLKKEKAEQELEEMEEGMKRPIERVDLEGNVLKQYRTGDDVCEELGCETTQLWKHLCGKTSSCQGHTFRFRGVANRPKTAGELAELAELQEGMFNTPLFEDSVAPGLDSVLAHLTSAAKGKRAFPFAVNLNCHEIGDDGAEKLAEMIEKSTVSGLFLVNNAISNAGAIHLSLALSKNKSLTALYLNDNNIGDEGVLALCSALGDSSLRTLNISVNQVSDRGAQHLSQLLMTPTCKLRTLILSGPFAPKSTFAAGSSEAASVGSKSNVSRIGPEGTACISAALISPHGCTLQKLWLANCDLGPVGFRSLSAALFCNDGLLELNISGNLCGPNEHSLLVQAAAQNTRLRSITADGCGLSQREVNSLRLAVDTYRHGVPKRDAQEHRAVSMVAAELRKELLDRVRTKGLTFPKQPEGKLKVAIKSHRRAKETIEEPIWKRHDVDAPWTDLNIETLLAGPVPLGESFQFLGRLCSSLHGTEAALSSRVKDLHSRSVRLAEQEVDIRSRLSTCDEEKRNASIEWNNSIANETHDARQSQLQAESAEKSHQIGIENLLEYEKGLHTATVLVKEIRETAEKAVTEFLENQHRENTSDAIALAKLAALNSDLAARLESGLFHQRLSQDALVEWKDNLIPDLERSLAAAQGAYSTARTNVEAVFVAARDGLSALQASIDASQALLNAVVGEAQEVARGLAPAAPLLARFSTWLLRLDSYFVNAMEAEAWRHSVITCGNPAVDNQLRNAISTEHFRKKRLHATLADLFEASSGITELKLMGAEDVFGHRTLIRVAEQATKRMSIEHRAVAMLQVTQTSAAAAAAATTNRPSVLAESLFLRANLPNGGEEFRAAAALSFAASSGSATHDRASSTKGTSKRKEIEGKPETPLPSMVLELRKLADAVEDVRRWGAGPEGAPSREILRGLTRPSTSTLGHVRRHDDILKAQFLDEAIAAASNIPIAQLAKELERFGVPCDSVADHAEMVSKLASLRVDSELAARDDMGGVPSSIHDPEAPENKEDETNQGNMDN